MDTSSGYMARLSESCMTVHRGHWVRRHAQCSDCSTGSWRATTMQRRTWTTSACHLMEIWPSQNQHWSVFTTCTVLYIDVKNVLEKIKKTF